MSQQQAENYAAILNHNRDAREGLRQTLAEKYKQGDTTSPGYKAIKDQHDRAERNIEKYAELLAELNAKNFITIK